uniref:Uncharacterized protein n=1 Tax=Ciona savignyi TaxID=51511 RepID=H2YID2_CIOSA
MNGHVNGNSVDAEHESSDEDDDRFKKIQPTPANEVMYLVRKLKVGGETEKVVAGPAIRRKPGTYNRQISKLFLKANCIKPTGQLTDEYVVLPKVLSQLGINTLEWEDIFVGPKPSFVASSPKGKLKKANGNASNKVRTDNGDSVSAKVQKVKNEIKQAKENEKEEK